MSVIVSTQPNVWQVSSNSEVINLDNYLWAYLAKIPEITESGAINLNQSDAQWNYQDRFELINNQWEPKKWFIKKLLEEKAKKLACSVYEDYKNNVVISNTSEIDQDYYDNLELISNDQAADTDWANQIQSEAIVSGFTGATASKDYAVREFSTILTERSDMKSIRIHIRDEIFTLFNQIENITTTAEGWTIDSSLEAWQTGVQTFVDSV